MSLSLFVTLVLIVVIIAFVVALCLAASKPAPSAVRHCVYCGEGGADVSMRATDGTLNHFHARCETPVRPRMLRPIKPYQRFAARQK